MDTADMKPDPSQYNPDPDYLRGLIAKLGMSQRAAARAIGISDTGLRDNLSGKYKHSYPTQYTLESLARYAE